MTPVNRAEISDLYVWSQIQYLDPDLQPIAKEKAPEPAEKMRKPPWPLYTLLLAVGALIGALVARFLPSW